MDKNITFQQNKITKEHRQSANGHKSVVIWFTGLSGSGKSTLAGKVEEALHNKGIKTYILDGDNVRFGLNKNLGFSPEDRKENIRRIGEVAKLFVDAGTVVLTAFISPYREDRETVRSLFNENEFIEIYLRCPLKVCEERDVKGLYKKARAGEIKEFTGISAPYEEPDNPELIVETNHSSLDSTVNNIINYIL